MISVGPLLGSTVELDLMFVLLDFSESNVTFGSGAHAPKVPTAIKPAAIKGNILISIVPVMSFQARLFPWPRRATRYPEALT